MLFQNARTVQCVEAVKKSVGRGGRQKPMGFGGIYQKNLGQ